MLLRQLTIIDAGSPYDGQTVDIRIQDGEIQDVARSLEPRSGEEEQSFEEGACVAPGFFDVGAYLGDPGHEEREDYASLVRQAAAGGYTSVAVLPNSDPPRQAVPDVAYLLRRNGTGPTDLLPLAAMSQDLAGKDLTQMLELQEAGALAFTDGAKKRISGSLLKRSLEYAKAGDCLVMICPYDETLAPEGQIHEGAISARLGLPGIPVMSETIALKQAIELVDYTEGTLIVHLLSSAAGVEEVRKAKATGLNVRATVSALHLQFTVEELAGFDPNFKIIPPLREEADREALIAGLADGTIDAIVTNHVARHGEEKDLEFFYADFGALALQTTFRQCLECLSGALSLTEIVGKLGAGPRTLLNQAPLHLRPRQKAELVIFSTDGNREFTKRDLLGKTENNPLLGHNLPGKIHGVVNNGKFHPAE
ncbi:dihydroorotase [Neolewinella antarctica]|uniref:Dihydroorotase n=1 Tax=Neolewinella antarctica TaxID=442734 RepID=A0ABX0XBA8_9BACT|nr:dihydroorotase [Neolewinella antarctica]NJC26558.1 dihydroorotase [Neolewinella antarctica]